jgi:hypothetical protein
MTAERAIVFTIFALIGSAIIFFAFIASGMIEAYVKTLMRRGGESDHGSDSKEPET